MRFVYLKGWEKMNGEINFNVRIAAQLKSDVERAVAALSQTHAQLNGIIELCERQKREIVDATRFLKEYWPCYMNVDKRFKDDVFAEQQPTSGAV